MRLIIVMAQALNLFSTFFVTYLLFCRVRSQLQIAPGTTYDELYASAIDKYNEENWEDTIFFMKNAIKEFKFYRVKLTECRHKCQSISQITSSDDDSWNELKFFHTIFKKAACLRSCKSAKLGDRQDRISEEATNKFLTLMPYSYLQFAYYKQHKYYEAQCAAFTYLKAHPGDDVMRNNLEYYYNVYGAENETIVDREERLHQKHFLDGNTAHEALNFTGVIEEFELALKFYWWAEEECRALCEGQYDSREFLDLYESIAGHYAHNLHCKGHCDDLLATMDGEVMPDYLAMHFHYLQYAYYKVGRISEAVDCAATFLLLKPEDVDMVNNMVYYEEELGVNKYQVKTHSMVQAYLERQGLEREVLQFARTYFWEEMEVTQSIKSSQLSYFESDADMRDSRREDPQETDANKGYANKGGVNRKGDNGEYANEKDVAMGGNANKGYANRRYVNMKGDSGKYANEKDENMENPNKVDANEGGTGEGEAKERYTGKDGSLKFAI